MFKNLLKEKKNLVFIGEAGSGKSELAINFALEIVKNTDKDVHFFDMDQVKPLFRSRDVAVQMEAEGIIFHCEHQLLDSPVVVSGVREQLADPESIVLMDIGGNEVGARMIGQFADILNSDTTMVFFVINTYRPWSKDTESIRETIFKITRVSRLNNIRIISNPNCGPTTTAEEVIGGNRKLEAMLKGAYQIDYVCVLEKLVDQVSEQISEELIPVEIHILYPWLQDRPKVMVRNGPGLDPNHFVRLANIDTD
ncbi:MAG: hypothetical protein IKF18_07070 [Erysipelotrichaceae bacterium]|nr:hypothetical protein [Erysipelotrichaceae bacterium]